MNRKIKSALLSNLIVLGIILLTISCASNKKTGEQSSEVLIKMEKTSCRGVCPVYSLSVFSDGKLEYSGQENVDMVGEYTSQLKNGELQSLIKAFEDANYFEFEDKYTGMVRDLPTTYLMYRKGDREKRIKDYAGAPKTLKQLEEKVESLINANDWKKKS